MLKDNVLVSVIIPVFNGAYYIEKCLNSLKIQIFKNFELIIIDNNSTDNSVELIKNFINLNPNIKINFLINEVNIGFIGNINRGLANLCISSAYIYIICIDDWIESNFLENCINILEINADCSLLSSATKLDNSDMHSKFIGNLLPPGVYNGSYICKMWFLYTFFYGINLFSYPVGIVIRRKSVDAINHFDENIGSPSDVDFFMRVIMDSKIVFTGFVGAHVLDHNDQHNKIYKKSGVLLLNQKKLIEKYTEYLKKMRILNFVKFITLSSSLIRLIRFGDNPAQYSLILIISLGPIALFIRLILYIYNYFIKNNYFFNKY
jgi:glycosyltransferase involved in cell wall biosynthesis